MQKKSQVNYRMFGSVTTIYHFSITHRIHMFLYRLVLLYFKCFEVPTIKISDISVSFLILPHISKTFGPISTKPYFFRSNLSATTRNNKPVGNMMFHSNCFYCMRNMCTKIKSLYIYSYQLFVEI